MGFSPTEQEVARQSLAGPGLVERLNIHELARETFASPSTIVRLFHHTGFGGYREFRKAVTAELLLREQNEKVRQRQLRPSDSQENIVEQITYKNILSLEISRIWWMFSIRP